MEDFKDQENKFSENKKKFWTQMLENNSKESIFIENLKKTLKTFQIINAILALITLIISQIEYEFLYYPTYYDKQFPQNDYKGNYIRILILVIILLLCNYYNKHRYK